jgi:hypothetical protein
MKLDRRKFERWLRAKKPEEIVGHNRECCSCPIALFYCETSGGSEISIFTDEWCDYIIDRGYIRTRAPAWAENFMFAVDGDVNVKISAARALEVLARS